MKVKRILALLLALTMVFGVIVSASAATIDTAANAGTVNITVESNAPTTGVLCTTGGTVVISVYADKDIAVSSLSVLPKRYIINDGTRELTSNITGNGFAGFMSIDPMVNTADNFTVMGTSALASLTDMNNGKYKMFEYTVTIPEDAVAGEYVVEFDFENQIGITDSNRAKYTLSPAKPVCTINVVEPPHEHNWSYSATGATITATCAGVGTCSVRDNTLTIQAPSDLVYSGSAKAATLSASTLAGQSVSASAISYSADPVNVGSYTASITVGGATASVDFEITAATAAYTAPTAKANLKYKGEQDLINAGTSSHGSFSYKVGDGDWSATAPKGTFGTYTVYWKFEPAANYAVAPGAVTSGNFNVEIGKAVYGSSIAGKTITIRKGSVSTGSLTAADFVSGLEGATITGCTGTDSDVIDVITVADGTLSYTSKNVSEDAEDEFTVTISSTYYEDIANVPLSFVATNKETIQITGTDAMAADDLVYNGAAKKGYTGTPYNANVDSFEIIYTDADGNELSGAPINAGTYKVTIRVPASNVDYTGKVEYSFTIAKAKPTGEPEYNTVDEEGKTLADITLSIGTIKPNSGTFAWDDSLTTEIKQGESYGWTFTPSDSNYDVLTGEAIPWPNDTSILPIFPVLGEGFKFDDVPANAYYADAVDWAVANGITDGISATQFAPDMVCTRAQMVTFLWRAAGTPAPMTRVMPFEDVPYGAYYYDAVLWAYENGITTGTSDTTFSPNAQVTRAQTVTFLWRSVGNPNVDSAFKPFVDVDENGYYYDAVLWAMQVGITNGTTATTFSPDAGCTRAQIVTFLYRCY